MKFSCTPQPLGASEDYQRSFIAITERGRIDFGTMEIVTSNVGHRSVNEKVGNSLPLEQYAKIAFAQSAEIQIGRTELTLKPEHLLSMKLFAIDAGVTQTDARIRGKVRD